MHNNYISVSYSNTLMGNDKSKLYRRAVNSAIPYLPHFSGSEISEFLMTLAVSKAQVHKIFPKIGNLMRHQIKQVCHYFDLHFLRVL